MYSIKTHKRSNYMHTLQEAILHCVHGGHVGVQKQREDMQPYLQQSSHSESVAYLQRSIADSDKIQDPAYMLQHAARSAKGSGSLHRTCPLGYAAACAAAQQSPLAAASCLTGQSVAAGEQWVVKAVYT